MKKTTPMTRLQLLQMSKENQEATQLAFTVANDKLQMESDILATRMQVEKLTAKVLALKSAPSLSSSEILGAQSELEGFQNGLVSLQALFAELFPAN